MSENQFKKIDHLDHATFDPSLDALLTANSNDDEFFRFPEDKKKHCTPQNWLWWTVAANLFTAFLYFLIFYQAAFPMSHTEEHHDVTIYTQAIEDWNAKAWTDFGWYKDSNCPEGYEPIGAYWQGTQRGNLTSYSVEAIADDDETRYAVDLEKVKG